MTTDLSTLNSNDLGNETQTAQTRNYAWRQATLCAIIACLFISCNGCGSDPVYPRIGDDIRTFKSRDIIEATTDFEKYRVQRGGCIGSTYFCTVKDNKIVAIWKLVL